MSSHATDEKTRFKLIPINCPPDCSFSDDRTATFWIDMSLIHNVLIKCLNSIYYNAPHVKQRDKCAFAGYCLSFTKLLHVHHHAEEEIVFPFLQTKLDMKHNLEQHATFTMQLEAFESHMKAIKNKKEDYDSEKVRKFVENFGDELVEHLHEEVRLVTFITDGNNVFFYE